MKINPLHKRSIIDPIAGVTFTKAEQDAALAEGKILAQLGYDTQRRIRKALAFEARRLDDALEFTSEQTEQLRNEDYEAVLLTLYALDLARTGFRWAAKTAKDS